MTESEVLSQNLLHDPVAKKTLQAHVVHQMVVRLKRAAQNESANDPKVKEPMTLFLYSINGLGKAPAPTQSSHQRLMKLRVSDVRDRLRRNQVPLPSFRVADV